LRKLFEQAEAIDPAADNGGVQLSLGVIYYRVPGFPIGFGNDNKAREYLEKALAMDPNGLDAAYFYGDFLIKEGEYRRAQEVLTHGLAAPVTANRPVWDKGRRGEIQALLAKTDKETHH
jgi:Tfp pilus assembly protein PilF